MKEKKVKALRKIVNPAKAKAKVEGQDAGGAWAVGIGASFSFFVPK